MNDTPSTPWLQTPQIMAFPTNEAIRSQSTLYKVPGAQLLSVREVIVSKCEYGHRLGFSLPFLTTKENTHIQFSTSYVLKDKGNFLLNFILHESPK